MKVAKAVGLTIDELHFVVEAFGDAVVAGKAPHGDDLFTPSSQGLAKLHQLRQAGLAQLVNGTKKTRNQSLALLPGTVFFLAASSTAAV